MNNNSSNKNEKKPNFLWVLVVLAISAVSGLLENRGGSMGFLVLAVFMVAMIAAGGAVALAAAKKAKTQTGAEAAPRQYTKTERSSRQSGSAASFQPPVFANRPVKSDRKPPVKQDSCGYDAANCNYSHDYQRRREQLDAFLKNGIIDKEEYKVLMDKYEKSIQL